MIENGLDDLEDYLYLAADVLERVRKGEEKYHSSAEVEERPWPGRLIHANRERNN